MKELHGLQKRLDECHEETKHPSSEARLRAVKALLPKIEKEIEDLTVQLAPVLQNWKGKGKASDMSIDACNTEAGGHDHHGHGHA